MSESLAHLAAATRRIYEKNAARFDAERARGLHEKAWLDRFLVRVAPGGLVLDLGCGAGEPIARYVLECGFDLVGFDASIAMLELARARWPEGDWRHGDMRTLNLPERFDGIIGWNSFFHLRMEEQRTTLKHLARHLKPAGALMLTVGPQAGEVEGQVGDDRVYHASLAPQEYEAQLQALELRVVQFVKEDASCDFQTVLLAQKRVPSSARGLP